WRDWLVFCRSEQRVSSCRFCSPNSLTDIDYLYLLNLLEMKRALLCLVVLALSGTTLLTPSRSTRETISHDPLIHPTHRGDRSLLVFGLRTSREIVGPAPLTITLK